MSWLVLCLLREDRFKTKAKQSKATSGGGCVASKSSKGLQNLQM
jgi:hypothetical protein